MRRRFNDDVFIEIKQIYFYFNIMKETYTRKEVIELLVNQGKKDYERYRKQLDENCRMFVNLMHESIDLAWEYIDEAQENNCCS